MEIIEQNTVPKNPKKKNEDGIVVTPNFIAVIDGSTSKTERRYSLFRSNGRYAMQIIAGVVKRMDKHTSCHQFCLLATKAIRKHYSKRQLEQLTAHPEERLTASCIVFSRLRREIWMVGDCQCLVQEEYFDNPKPYEQELAEQRASIINSSPAPHDHFLSNDTARKAIIPRMLETMQQQNKTYAVIDGFPIPEQHVRIITLDFQSYEIVLASDGYPFLLPTLHDSEQRLAEQRATDPLNIGVFKATKAFVESNNSFDDRSYIRFKA